MRHRTKWGALLVAVVVGMVSCDYATDVEVLRIEGTGVLFGTAYLDLNGTGVADAGDQPLKNAAVELTTPGSGDVVVAATTDTLGAFVLTGVPVGTYDIGLSSAVLGDSLTAIDRSGSITVAFGDTTLLSLGATFPSLTLSEIRATTPGRRVFALGVALNARSASTDGTIHIVDTTAVSWLRITNSSLPASSVLVGDSLRLLGRTAVNNGQPVLDAATAYVLQRGLSLPPPVETSVATAASANAGALDAAVVRIRLAEISDTSSAPNGDFHFWAHGATDSVEVVFKWFRGISSSAIRPDTVVRINQLTGLLTPYDDGTGSVRWRILPRAGSEVTLEVKAADLAVTTAFSPTTTTTGSTVEIVVAARNMPTSTHTATGVSVTDSIPAALTFQSATTTRGTFDSGTGVWTIGDMAPGVADTLRITVQVTGGPGSVNTRATLNPLTREVESGPQPNTQTATLTVS